MEIREYTGFCRDEILALYESVGWTNYVERPDMLERAYENSLIILGAYADERLVGIIRAVGDGASVVFIQDVIVAPEYQRRGIGTAMMKRVMERFAGVYQLELMTDDTPKTAAFYKSLGFASADEMGCRAFIKM